MKVFALAPRENWICDRFVTEWYEFNSDISATDPRDADVIRLLADWCWNHLPLDFLKNKIIVTSVHHLVPDKFGPNERKEFEMRDSITDFYHVPCDKTRAQIENLTKKPIFSCPFWANQNLWFDKPKDESRQKHNIPDDCFLIGSFQRDTEGHDLISPKLEKGPDLFFNAVEKLSDAMPGKVNVLLAGWRRQYIMSRLDAVNIPYFYHELPSFETINDFYNCLDLYVVAARYEGGPQAVVECALNKTPIISTDVGLASQILNETAIFNPGEALTAIPDGDYAYEKVTDLMIPNGFKHFRDFFKNITSQ